MRLLFVAEKVDIPASKLKLGNSENPEGKRVS